MILHPFWAVHSLKHYSPFKDVTVDDWWDQINRCYVFIIILTMCICVSLKQYGGETISCDGFTKFSKDFAEDYCWAIGMYTIREAYDQPSTMVPYPGVIPDQLPACVPRMLKNGTILRCPSEKDILPGEKIFHLWYQWVQFYFAMVAAAYYCPYLLFKHFAAGEYKPLIQQLSSATLADGKAAEKTQERVVSWLYYRFKNTIFGKGIKFWVKRNSFSFAIGITKLLYLGITVAVFYLTGEMFEYGSGAWHTYGANWFGTRFTLYERGRVNQTTLNKDKLFPKMVSCQIQRFGPSGLEMETAQCVLAPNVLYQYFFLITWFVLIVAFFSNLCSCFLHLSEMFFWRGTYERMIDDCMMPNRPRYQYVFKSIGAGGRELIQVLMGNTHPVIFTRIFDELTFRLVTKASMDVEVIKNQYSAESPDSESEGGDKLV